jgi:hypothetical protein
MELHDIVSIVAAVIAFGALGVSFYNARRTWRVARQVDSLVLDDRRFEALQRIIDTQTLRTKQQTSVASLRNRMRTKMTGLSDVDKDIVKPFVDHADTVIERLRNDVTADRSLVEQADALTAPTTPTPVLIQRVNAFLGMVKVRHSRALLEQADDDSFISGADDVLAAAQSHTRT